MPLAHPESSKICLDLVEVSVGRPIRELELFDQLSVNDAAASCRRTGAFRGRVMDNMCELMREDEPAETGPQNRHGTKVAPERPRLPDHIESVSLNRDAAQNCLVQQRAGRE